MKQGYTLKRYRIKDNRARQIEKLAEEWKMSETAAIEDLILKAYSETVTDENIIMAQLAALEKKLSQLSNKCDTFFKLIYFILPNLFARLPPLPKGKDEAQISLNRGSTVMQKLVTLFRKDEKEHDISFLQSVYGDTQESLAEGYERG